MLVYPLMGLVFLGSMYLIFAPSSIEDEKVESVGGFNAAIPLPAGDGIIADKQKAYEQEQMKREESAIRESLNLIPDEEPQPSKKWRFVLSGRRFFD